MIAAELVPDLAEAESFLTLLAEGEPVTFQTFDDDKARKRGSLARILHGTLDDHADGLARLNAAGAGVFWMVNFGDGIGRTAENVTGVRALFVDLDGAPLAPVEACTPEPHCIVESSPGRFHAYWLVAGCPAERFSGLQEALARRFQGDASVKDLPRVLRLPGFIHRKGEPFMSRIVRAVPMQPYGLAELVQGLGLDLAAPAATTEPAAADDAEPREAVTPQQLAELRSALNALDSDPRGYLGRCRARAEGAGRRGSWPVAGLVAAVGEVAARGRASVGDVQGRALRLPGNLRNGAGCRLGQPGEQCGAAACAGSGGAGTCPRVERGPGR